MKPRLTPSLILFALLLGGCASTPFTNSTVVDRHIKNTSVGFNGFEMTLPHKYYRYAPQPDNAKTTNYAQLAWDFSAEADTNSGSVLEKIPFAKPGYGITLSIYSPSFYVPSPRELYYKEYID